MKNKPSLTRDHIQYKEIEQFKDFEITTCIAFEMAIRHPWVVKIIEQLFYFREEGCNYYCTIKLKTINHSKKSKLIRILKKYYFIDYECLKYDIINLKQYSFINLFIQYPEINLSNPPIKIKYLRPIEQCKFKILKDKNLLHSYIKPFNLKYWKTKVKQKSWFEKSRERFENIIEALEKLEDSPFSNFSNLEYKEIDEEMKLSFIDSDFSAKGVNLLAYDTKFKDYHNPYPFEGENEDIRLFPLLENKKYLFSQLFSRPELILPKHVEKNINVKLNLNLPEEELIEYIKNIKSIYGKEKLLFENTKDLMQKKDQGTLNEALAYVPLLEQLPKDYGKHKTKQEKYADILFVYDAIKIGMPQRAVAEELDRYHDKLNPTDIKTIRKYRDIAIDFIEKRKYLELYTNLPMENFDPNNKL